MSVYPNHTVCRAVGHLWLWPWQTYRSCLFCGRFEDLAIGYATVSLSGNKMNFSATVAPTVAGDLAMDATTGLPSVYVDGTATQLPTTKDVRKRCRAAATADIANFTTGAPDTLDNVALVQGDRVFLPVQTSGEENGPYKVDTLGTGANGVWTRVLDHDHTSDFVPGSEFYIEEGDVNGRTVFQQTTTAAITVDTTVIEYNQGAPLMRSDPAGVALALTTSGADNITSAANISSSVDCRDYKNVTFILTMSARTGTPADLYLPVQWSDDGTLWELQQTEAISAGLATQSNYVPDHDISAETTFNYQKSVTVPTLGRRYWRVAPSCNANSLTATAKYMRGA